MLIVQIGDLGLSRKLKGKNSKEMLNSTRWAAPEKIKHNTANGPKYDEKAADVFRLVFSTTNIMCG